MDVYLFEIQIDKETTGTICRKLVQKKASIKFCKYSPYILRRQQNFTKSSPHF